MDLLGLMREVHTQYPLLCFYRFLVNTRGAGRNCTGLSFSYSSPDRAGAFQLPAVSDPCASLSAPPLQVLLNSTNGVCRYWEGFSC